MKTPAILGPLPKTTPKRARLRSATAWTELLVNCGIPRVVAARWGVPFANVVREDTFSAGDRDLADFLPEIIHESSGLQRMEENLNYSEEALLATFNSPRRIRITPEQARAFGRNKAHAADQQAIANIVYGGAFGRENLGNTQEGDGWKFRGRGPLQITGSWNYTRMGKLMGQDLTSIPDLLAQPHYALQACILWWEENVKDDILGETTSIRKRVNGGNLGLLAVQALTNVVRQALANESAADL